MEFSPFSFKGLLPGHVLILALLHQILALGDTITDFQGKLDTVLQFGLPLQEAVRLAYKILVVVKDGSVFLYDDMFRIGLDMFCVEPCSPGFILVPAQLL